MLELLQSQKQTQTIHTDQVIALNILAFTSQELEHFLQKEYYDNPMLEQISPPQGNAAPMDSLFPAYNETWKVPVSGEQNYGDDYYDREQYSRELSYEEPYTLEQLITDQLDSVSLTEEEREYIMMLIEHTDEKGFLTIKIDSIYETCRIPPNRAGEILRMLQHLDPPGLFSQNLEDYLIFQLKENDCRDEKLFQLIRTHLKEILSGHLSNASRALGVSTAQIRTWLQTISQLKPRPLSSVDTRKPSYLIPDLIVSRAGDNWEIQINDTCIGSYDLNSYYLHMLSSVQDPELKQYFTEKYKRARFILECVEKRKSTLEKIVRAILSWQTDYFLNGNPLRPMTLSDIATIAEVSESTVSRSIREKTMQFKTILPLKELFSTAAGSASELSQQTVLQIIGELIRTEDKNKPLSDSKLAALLADRGIQVSRRAVTKYRESMHIPDSRHRF